MKLPYRKDSYFDLAGRVPLAALALAMFRLAAAIFLADLLSPP